ncbi:MAG TPA: hypothetical protein VMD91_09400 [Candidatus Sulfotelmatobacter sp.]|nr:hypothetical protein [Candidatus Sulfotelmatobacter sp.]
MRSVSRMVLTILATWQGLAAIQNLADVLVEADLAPQLRPVASKNYPMIADLLAPLHPPRELVLGLLTGCAAVETLAAVALARGASGDRERAENGFALSLGLFGAFFLIDDAFDAYEMGAKHRDAFVLFLAAAVAVRLEA